MREIIPAHLWLGNAYDARAPQKLFDLGIAAVVDLAYEEAAAGLPRSLAYVRIPLVDGGGNDPRLLKWAIDTVESLIAAQIPTLVACGAGMSRSPCVAAAALARHRKESPETVLKQRHAPTDGVRNTQTVQPCADLTQRAMHAAALLEVPAPLAQGQLRICIEAGLVGNDFARLRDGRHGTHLPSVTVPSTSVNHQPITMRPRL